MKRILITLSSIALLTLSAAAQTNVPAGPLSTLQGYLVNNDLSYTGWESNTFTLWQGAAFSSVKGVAGASDMGQDMGLELPLRSFTKQSFVSKLSLDSTTRFEQVFGDIHSQQLGIAYNYNYGQVQLTAGLDARYQFADSSIHAVPYIEFKKATTLAGVSPFFRYSYPITKKPGAGEIDLGVCFSFGKKW